MNREMQSPSLLSLVQKLALLSVVCACPAGADTLPEMDDIIVTATRVATPGEEIGSSVTVITREQIERRQYRTLSEALRSVSGLRVVQSGGAGQQSSVFIRGASSSHTLVLFDGVDISDPANPSRAVDFANLLMGNVERIEVVRGPQSTLYGSSAIGGVINVITRKGEGDAKADVMMEAGSNSTVHQLVSAYGQKNDVNYSVSLEHAKTHSDSVTPKRLRDGVAEEADRSRNYTLSTRLGTALSEVISVDFTGRYADSETGFDPELGPFGTVEDEDAQLDEQKLFLRGESVFSLLDGQWDARLSIAHTRSDRKTNNDRTDPFATLERVHFIGENTDISLDNDFFVSENHTLALGLGTRKEEMDASGFRDFGGFIQSEDSEGDARTNFAYLQDQFSFGRRIFGTLGARVDDHDDFDSETTYRVTAVYRHLETDTRFTTSVGTGFRAPSQFELHGFTPTNFGTAYSGNPDLEPETSFGWDLGFDQTFAGGDIKFGATYFENEIDDLIQTVFDASFNSTSENVDEVEIKGVESFIAVTPVERLHVNLAYTNQDIDLIKGIATTAVVRRPKDKASLDFDYQVNSRGNVYLGVDYVGQRKDIDRATGAVIRAKSYTTATMAASYRLAKDWKIFGRVENLTDEHYEPADGFQAPGRWFIVGAQLSL